MIMHYRVNTIPVGVLGASGYAGRELCSLIARHPRFSLAFATANEQRGQSVRLGGRTIAFAAPDDIDLSRWIGPAPRSIWCSAPCRMARRCHG